MSETAWVIEGDGKYWTGSHADERGFSSDNNEACRFSRRQDADKVKFWLLRTFAFALRTTEHRWVDGASPSPTLPNTRMGEDAVREVVEAAKKWRKNNHAWQGNAAADLATAVDALARLSASQADTDTGS